VPTFFAEIIGPELLIVIAVAVLLFGGSQIPKLARSLGQAQHEFKRGLKDGKTDGDDNDQGDDDRTDGRT
jgi:sec-independent protein translocase protein TatA